jgi:hypothetical protein
MKWPFFSSKRNYGLKGCEEKSTKLSDVAAARLRRLICSMIQRTLRR